VAIEIRPVRSEEHAEAGRVTVLAYREFGRPDDPSGWEQYLEHIADVEGRVERTVVLVATQDGRILGSATLELEGRVDDDDPALRAGEAHVRMLGVHPDARGRGIARMLMGRCFEEAAKAGKIRMTLNTTPRMEVAQAMYERLGFVRGQDRTFPDGFVLLSYARPIEPVP